MMTMDDVLAVMNTEEAAALSLSKGGWEGWLQCELWAYLSVEKGLEVEREVAYPYAPTKRCDLVVRDSGQEQWIELKAHGIFREDDVDRFLDLIAADIYKIVDRPANASGKVVVVVTHTIEEAFTEAMIRRGWFGFEAVKGEYAVVFYMNF